MLYICRNYENVFKFKVQNMLKKNTRTHLFVLNVASGVLLIFFPNIHQIQIELTINDRDKIQL